MVMVADLEGGVLHVLRFGVELQEVGVDMVATVVEVEEVVDAGATVAEGVVTVVMVVASRNNTANRSYHQQHQMQES